MKSGLCGTHWLPLGKLGGTVAALTPLKCAMIESKQ